MLSAVQAAEMLQVSPARVRALIKAGNLPATKVGRAWCVREEDVYRRVASHPGPGRPRLRNEMKPADDAKTNGAGLGSRAVELAGTTSAASPDEFLEAHELYLACKKLFQALPGAEMMQQARSQEEASFYMAVADFFLQQKQAQLVAEGVC